MSACCGWETIDIRLYISECESNPGYVMGIKYETTRKTGRTKNSSGLTNLGYNEGPELIDHNEVVFKGKGAINNSHSFKLKACETTEFRNNVHSKWLKLLLILCSFPLVLKTIRNKTRKSPNHSKYTENPHFSARTANKRTVPFISCRSWWTSFSDTHTWNDGSRDLIEEHPRVVLDYLTEHLTQFTLEIIRNRNLRRAM